MLENPMDVLAQFPIRKSKKQKAAFRDAVQSYAGDLGYQVNVEKGSFGAQNVIIGDPKQAKYLITAHYDTPASIGIPNFITPTNPVTFLIYQFLVVGLFFLAAGLAGFAVYWLTEDNNLTFWTAYIVYFGMLLLMMFGPANRSNANDNTSGVVTVLETAKSMPAELRDKVCFVLFDLEEAGLIGSAAYAKAHKKEVKNQTVLNCDCVGDGDELMMFPTKKVKKDQGRMDALRSICKTDEAKSMTLREKGFSYYPSDQNNFPHGVGIAAFRRSKLAGLYCDKIHTWKDTILDEKNVSFLRNALIELVSRAA